MTQQKRAVGRRVTVLSRERDPELWATKSRGLQEPLDLVLCGS